MREIFKIYEYKFLQRVNKIDLQDSNDVMVSSFNRLCNLVNKDSALIRGIFKNYNNGLTTSTDYNNNFVNVMSKFIVLNGEVNLYESNHVSGKYVTKKFNNELVLYTEESRNSEGSETYLTAKLLSDKNKSFDLSYNILNDDSKDCKRSRDVISASFSKIESKDEVFNTFSNLGCTDIDKINAFMVTVYGSSWTKLPEKEDLRKIA